MGQGSKLAIWSTHGELRWRKEGKYKEEKPHYKGIREFVENKNTVHLRTVIVLKSKRNI